MIWLVQQAAGVASVGVFIFKGTETGNFLVGVGEWLLVFSRLTLTMFQTKFLESLFR